MGTMWNSYPIECRGGLVTNISPLQLAMNQPGAARKLVNFEPSVEGGYRRVLGYNKVDGALWGTGTWGNFDWSSGSPYVPPYGNPLVQDGGQSGTTLNIANIYSQPADESTFTIDGVTGTYTISSSTYNDTNKTAALTITPSLASSPADQAAITFTSGSTKINGLYYWCSDIFAFRGTDLWKNANTGWEKISVPSYGTVLVAGGSQTGTTLDVDGLTAAPQAGDTFTIDSVDLVYTVTADATLAGDAATLTIAPALDSSPADNAAITFLSTDVQSDNKVRFLNHTFAGTRILVGVNGTTAPFKYDGTTFSVINDAPSDVVGATFVAEFANHIFYAKDNLLSFTAPFTDDDLTPANGGGVITLPYNITGLIAFRDQLIVFTARTIHRILGNSFANFELRQITEDIGCLYGDTVQEVGGDILFMSQDGVRFLSATERIGDFGLSLASRSVFDDMVHFRSNHEDYNTLVIRNKNQYRLFGYTEATPAATSKGWLVTQFEDQSSMGMAWAELQGFKVYTCYSVYCPTQAKEIVIFANNDGYVYNMEAGNSFDGANIKAEYHTPYIVYDDPRVRKTIYKLDTYLDPEGTVTGKIQLRFDYGVAEKIQPAPINFTNDTSETSLYGTARWGDFRWGDSPKFLFRKTTVGSGFNVSYEYTFDSTDPPFSIDVVLSEYALKDRR